MAEALNHPEGAGGVHSMSAWENSTRRDRLPPNWATIRIRILRRDNRQCQWIKTNGKLCLQPADQVDHRNPGDDHDDENLQALCEWHHGKKSGGEGGRASQARRKSSRGRLTRPTMAHPSQL